MVIEVLEVNRVFKSEVELHRSCFCETNVIIVTFSGQFRFKISVIAYIRRIA